MKKVLLIPSILFAVMITFNQCKKSNEGPDGKKEEIKIEAGQQKVTGNVDLPPSVDPKEITLTTTSGSYSLQNDGSFTAASAKQVKKQVILAENSQGELLLASLLGVEGNVLNASSTAKSMIALMPWTAYVDDNHDLTQLLNDIAALEEFNKLVTAIGISVAAGDSPFTNETVKETLSLLVNKISGIPSDEKSQKPFSVKEVSIPELVMSVGAASLPEVDFLVEPRLSYANGNLLIDNDGTTTAAWGVEVLNAEGSLTGNLILPGNVIQFPSLSSIWSALSGNLSNAVFQQGETLEIPLHINDKYKLKFVSPSSPQLASSSLALEAAYYNIANSYSVIFKAFGIELPKVSDFIDRGCANKIFDATTQVIVDHIKADKLTVPFFLGQMSNLFKASAKTLVECAGLFTNFDGGEMLAREKYLRKMVSFLDLYSKAEASFVLGKLFGDMLVLKDINICRQVIDGNIYPCFSLKSVGMKDRTVDTGGKINLEVATQLDAPSVDEAMFPTGVPINWVVTKGTGTLSAPTGIVNNDGISTISFTAGEEPAQQVKAFVAGPNGKEIQSVVYEIKADDKMALLRKAVVNKTLKCYYDNDGNVGELIAELTFKEDGNFQIIHTNESEIAIGTYTYTLVPVTDPTNPNYVGYLSMSYNHPHFGNYWLIHSASIYRDLTVYGSNGIRILKNN